MAALDLQVIEHGDVIRCVAVTAVFRGERRVRLSISSRNEAGQIKLSGEAVVALD